MDKELAPVKEIICLTPSFHQRINYMTEGDQVKYLKNYFSDSSSLSGPGIII
jgi:hypothetical protein